MNNIITLYGNEVALFVRLVSIIQVLLFVFPLQLREFSVRNGLIKLRQQLLLFGVIIFLINVISTLFLINVVFFNYQQSFVDTVIQLFNAFSFLIISTIGSLIYHSQYSKESKDYHEELEEKH